MGAGVEHAVDVAVATVDLAATLTTRQGQRFKLVGAVKDGLTWVLFWQRVNMS